MVRLTILDNRRHCLILTTNDFKNIGELKSFVNEHIEAVIPELLLLITNELNKDVGFFQATPYGFEAVDFNEKILSDKM